MAYRVPSERVGVDVAEGLTIEVERLRRGPLQRTVFAALAAALGPKPDSLEQLRGIFVGFAQPTWSIIDHVGVVPATAEGLRRLDDDLALAMIVGWAETSEEKTTAADELLPEGPMRDEVNRRLRLAKAA